jgi:hypothetical protein
VLARIALSVSIFIGLANAAAFSFSGSVAHDGDLILYNVNLLSAGAIDVRTFSYGGGTNAASTVFGPGGFAPSLALYDSLGNLQAIDSLGGSVNPGPPATCSNGSNVDTSVGLCLDAHINFSGLAGNYVLVLSEQGNDGPSSFSDGYPVPAGTDQNPGPFVDPFSNARNGNCALDITLNGTAAPQTASTPEPSTFAFALTAGAVLAVLRKRFQKIN